ncbi:Extracellular matrix protein FRAS1, partial [Araneus ventricosus]
DIFPPIITRNSGLKVNEKGHGCITAEMLAAIDEHQKTLDLAFSIVLPPSLGYLEHKHTKTLPLNTFLMSDLKAGEVCYIHSSLTSNPLDSFTFNVSDGRNSVLQTFYINISSVYNSLPIVKLSPLKIKEGEEKVITEFEIDIFDKDTQDQDVIIKVLKPPQHGILKNANTSVSQVFSLYDIKHGRISYFHDGSESVNDSFTLIVSDGINKEYIFVSNNLKNVTSRNPV